MRYALSSEHQTLDVHKFIIHRYIVEVNNINGKGQTNKDLYSYAVGCTNTDESELEAAESAAFELIREVDDKTLRSKLNLAILDISSRAKEFGFDAGAQLQHAITKTEYPKIKWAWEQAEADSKEAQNKENKESKE